jgi:hypothetical protein
MNNKIGKFCNCTKKDECPSPGSNYECCSEAVPNGSPARFGLWMEQSTCDPSKGLPKDAHLMSESYRNFAPVSRFGTREGFNDGSQQENCMMQRQIAMQQAAMQDRAMQQRAMQQRAMRESAMQDRGYEQEEDEDENDPCRELRGSLNLLLFLMLIGVIGASLYYLKSQKGVKK